MTPVISPASAASMVPTSVAVAAQDVHHVREVLLLLLVVGGHPLDRVRQQGPVEGVAAGVVLVDGPLLGRGIAFLDDAQERAVAVPDDPAVPGGVAARGEHGDRVARPVMAIDEFAQRLAAQQRHVAVAHHDRAGDGADRLGDHADRVPGAELLVLAHDPRLRGDRGHLRADLLPAMPDDDHELGRVKLVGRRERVPEQGAAAQRVQHLGGAGLHALALAGGEDDDCGRGSFAHEKSISSDIAPNICQGHHPREPHCAERRRFCLLAPHPQDTCL